MEKTTLDLEEVIDFMQSIAPNVGDIFSSNMIRRRFRTGYMNARKTLDELVEMGYVELNRTNHILYHLKK